MAGGRAMRWMELFSVKNVGGILLMVLVMIAAACQPERKGGPLMAGDIAPDFAAKDLVQNMRKGHMVKMHKQ